VQQRRMRAIQLERALVNDGKRHHRAVRGLGFYFFGNYSGEVHWRGRTDFVSASVLLFGS